MSNTHGNHWECLLKPVETAIEHFLPATLAAGKLQDSIRRVGLWFDREQPTEEAVHSIVRGDKAFRTMALVVSDGAADKNIFYSAFPYAAKGSRHRLRLTEIRDWGNEVEAVLVGETTDERPVAFFDTRYFIHRDRYRVGEEYDFRLAGLIYEARCTNEETIEITDPEWIADFCKEPERLADGSFAPVIIHMAGCTGYAATSDEYPEDAEFYCVIGKVTEFDLERIRIFQITPKIDDKNSPLPGVIFGAASIFEKGYVPKAGDSIGGGLWTQGFLDQTAKKPRPR